MANALEGDIQAERDRTGIHDPAHFAYSTSAKALIQRRENLKRSIDELKRQLGDSVRTTPHAPFGYCPGWLNGSGKA
jgi:flagellar protein FliJ